MKILLDEDRSFQIGMGMKDKDRVEMQLACTECRCIYLEPIRSAWGRPRIYSS